MTARGGCLCGAVRYTVSAPLTELWACHCTMCRKTSGHFVAATMAPRGAFQITGADAVTWYESSPGIRRGFCGRCGSQLFWDDTAAADLSICAGTLDTDLDLTLDVHIFCADKGSYYKIDGDAEQWPGAWGEDRPNS